jgi:hypothetical protein
MTNFFDSVKVETTEYQRDFIVTQKNILRDFYIDWLKLMPFESDTDFLEVIRDNQIPIAERLSIEGFLVIEFRVTIRSLRGFCLDSENVPTENVSIYFNDEKKYEVDEDIYLDLVNQDNEEITATFEGNKIIVSQESAVCEDASYLVEYENGTEIESGTIPSGGSVTIEVPNPIAIDTCLISTGADTALNSGDDGDRKRGKPFFTLLVDNLFGHNRRFVGKTGGYHNGTTWVDVNGTPTTEALAFPDDIVIDFAHHNDSEVLVYRKDFVYLSGAASVFNGGIAHVFAGLDLWIANRQEVNNLLWDGAPIASSIFNYPPFNFTFSGAANDRLRTSTPIGSQYVEITNAAGLASGPVTNTRRHIWCNYVSYADLGL